MLKAASSFSLSFFKKILLTLTKEGLIFQFILFCILVFLQCIYVTFTNRKSKNIKENLSHVKKKDTSKSEDCCITGG